uniref:Uncharacterized protein n=1 Tax=Chenopodium quinoa TaxID=63459 RepID=A0A803M8B5_CHEQI
MCAMDSSVPTDPNNAKDYTDVHFGKDKEVAADVGSSGAAADVGSSGAAVDVGSSGVVVAKEKLEEKKQKRIKLVTTKGKGKKVEKGVKEKKNVKFEDPDSEDVVDEMQGSKSVVYGTFCNRMSPSSVVNVFKKLSEDQLIAIRAIGFGSLQFLKVSQLPLQLGFWLVKHFDAQSCSLNIPNSEPFKITEQLYMSSECDVMLPFDLFMSTFSWDLSLQSIVVVAEMTTEPGSMEGKTPSSVVNIIARKGVGGSDPTLVKDKLGKRSRESEFADDGGGHIPKKVVVIIIEKLRLKYSFSIISSEVNTINPVKQIVQKKKKAKEASDTEES